MELKQLPEDVGLFANITFEVGPGREDFEELAVLNDTGRTFEDIANLIEQYVPTHD